MLGAASLNRSGHFPAAGGRAGPTWHVRFTAAADGNLRVDQPADELTLLRKGLVDLPWTWLHQVHGAEVVVVDQPGQHAGVDADAAVTVRPGLALAVHTADCVPLALIGGPGVGAVHAGWKGLAAGVVQAAVGRLRSLGASEVTAIVGPCIHAECYEFGPAELEPLVDRYGPEVRAQTATGGLALDLPAATLAALRAAGVDDVEVVPLCTACDRRFFSHRARGDQGRQAMVVWMDR